MDNTELSSSQPAGAGERKDKKKKKKDAKKAEAENDDAEVPSTSQSKPSPSSPPKKENYVCQCGEKFEKQNLIVQHIIRNYIPHNFEEISQQQGDDGQFHCPHSDPDCMYVRNSLFDLKMHLTMKHYTIDKILKVTDFIIDSRVRNNAVK